MKKTLITGAKLVKNGKITAGRSMLIGGGKIIASDYRGDLPEDTEIYDAKGAYLLPSFIEIHAHGGGNCDFIDNTKEAFDTIMQTHLSHGVTMLCPTLVACDWEKAIAFLRLCDEYGKHSPMFGGVHLEGPFLSPAMCGAQNLSCIVPPAPEKIAQLDEFVTLLARITAAPEIEGAELLARHMTARGVKLSVGHSSADAPTMAKAAEWGFSEVTHLFCSTSRRAKFGSYVIGGIEECALIDNRFTVELIGDGHHISRESFLLTEKCKGKDGVVLVSDAMRAAGYNGSDNVSEAENDLLADSYLGEKKPENRVIIESGVAKLPDRSSFAGSIAVGDTMVQALVGRYGLPLPTISHMMSAVPAKLLGLAKRGKLSRGYTADLTLLDENYRTTAVFMGGEKVYEAHA